MEPEPVPPADPPVAAPTVPPAAPVARVAARARPSVDTLRGFAIELVIVTVGVLIALSVDSLREWNHDRRLVREARATIAREIAANKADIDAMLIGLAADKIDIATALAFANDLLAKRESKISQFRLNAQLADLTDAGWQSAARTGALAHMDFGDVQRYSRLYELQELFVEHQRRSVERATGAFAIAAGGDPHAATPADLEMFRQRLLAMSGDQIITEQLAKRLSESYAAMLR